MSTRFFRFPDEAAFLAAMPQDFARDGETGYPLAEGIQAIRIMPHPMKRGGRWELSADGMYLQEVEAPEVLPGFHVNALGEPPEAWAPFEVYPSEPLGVFGAAGEEA